MMSVREKAILEQFGTPLLCYQWQQIQEQLDFQRSLGVISMLPVRICPEPVILSLLGEQGCGMICASYGELQMIQRLQFPPEQIWLDSMAPDRASVELAVRLGARVAVTDYEMCRRVLSWGARHLLVRYQTDKVSPLVKTHPMMQRLQMFNRQLIPVCKLLEEGIDIVLETVLDGRSALEGSWTEAAERLLAGRKVLQRSEFAGFGGISLNLQGLLNADVLGREIPGVLAAMEGQNAPVYLQAGRLLVEGAGTMYARVERVRLGAPDQLVLNLSSAQLPRTALLGSSHSYSLLESREEGAGYYEITGYLPERTEQLHAKVLLPRVQCGDILRIHGVGAYERAMSSGFGGSLGCPVVLVRQGKTVLLRRRQTSEDLLRDIVVW